MKRNFTQELEDAINEERTICRCSERLGYDESGNYSCDGFCAGCRNYNNIDVVCGVRENVRVALCEAQAYDELGLDDYS